jgi:hypothetical protein
LLFFLGIGLFGVLLLGGLLVAFLTGLMLHIIVDVRHRGYLWVGVLNVLDIVVLGRHC